MGKLSKQANIVSAHITAPGRRLCRVWSICSTLLGSWQQRCGLSLWILQQLVIHYYADRVGLRGKRIKTVPCRLSVRLSKAGKITVK